jgi:hypothetical protein
VRSQAAEASAPRRLSLAGNSPNRLINAITGRRDFY